MAVLTVVSSAIALSAASHQNPVTTELPDDTVAIGVACGDGTFVPLAARTNGNWTALSKADERVSLEYFFGVLTPQALNLPRRGWTLYPRGEASRPLVLQAVRKALATESGDCFVMQAYDSDAVRGIGILGPARFERGEDMTTQPDEVSRRAAARVVGAAHAIERRLDSREGRQSPLRRFDGRNNVRAVVQLLAMVRYRVDGGDLYFFQARKEHRERYVFEGEQLDKEWARTLVHGWLRVLPASVDLLSVSGEFEGDDGKTGAIYRSAGLLKLDDRAVMITEGHGYESQFYELFEIGPGAEPPHSVLVIDVGGS